MLARYDAAAGGLLAGGLAYSALFAIVPAILLLAGLSGVVFGDAGERARVVEFIAGVLPPIRELVRTILTEASGNAAPIGILAVATLAWGASRFVVAFSESIGRVMGRTHRRGLVAANAIAIGAVLILIVAILGGAILAGLLSFLDEAEATGFAALLGTAIRLALGFLPPVLTIVAMVLVYRAVPVPHAEWRAVLPPAVVVGLVLTLLLRVFVFLAPRLIGAAALLGTVAAVFAALAWLALTFQAILLGAAWVGERDAGVSDRPLEPGPEAWP